MARLALVDDAVKVLWKSWSNRVTLLNVLLQVLWSAPEAMLTIYRMLPDDVQFLLPGRTMTMVILGVLAVLARILQQANLKGAENGEADGRPPAAGTDEEQRQ